MKGIIRIVGLVLMAIGMFWLGLSCDSLIEIGIGLLLIVGTIIAICPSLWDLD